MKIIKLIILFILLISFCSCKNKNRIEKQETNEFIVEKKFEDDTMISSRSINKRDNVLEYDFNYNKKGIITKVIEYYKNGKVKTVSTLDKEPYFYLDKGYYPNGKLEHEGSVSYINQKKYRIGWWIFYNNNGTVNSMIEFDNDEKGNEWIIQKKDVEVETQNFSTDTVKLFNPE